MSQTDSFVDEVNEELRRERLYATLRRWGPIALLAVLALVGYAAWSEWQDAKTRQFAQDNGDAIYAALEADDPAARAIALQTLETSGPVAALLQSAALEEAGQRVEAVAVLDAVDTTGQPLRVQDLVALKRQMLSPDAAALTALAQPGRPYRLLAAEQLVLLAQASGDNDGAIAGARAIIDDAEVTAGLRDRMETVIVALGGSLDAA